MTKLEKRNKYFFGLGTVGRDMFYAFEANALLYYLSNVLSLPVGVFAAASMVLTVLRILDALNDPITGLIIDNIHSPWGKYKPPMLIGAVTSSAFFLILFADFGLTNYWFVVVFGLAYILWDITYGVNDIAYWSMLPSLTMDQKKRENMGAFARICANVGMFAIMVAWEPVTSAMGNTPHGWFIVAVAVTVAMLGFQCFTLLGVKEDRSRFKTEEGTSLRQMFSVLFKNDQLMWTTLSMALFMVATARPRALRCTTCSTCSGTRTCTPSSPRSWAFRSSRRWRCSRPFPRSTAAGSSIPLQRRCWRQATSCSSSRR